MFCEWDYLTLGIEEAYVFRLWRFAASCSVLKLEENKNVKEKKEKDEKSKKYKWKKILLKIRKSIK